MAKSTRRYRSGYKRRGTRRTFYGYKKRRRYAAPRISYAGKTNFKPTMAFAKLVAKALQKKQSMSRDEFKEKHTRLFNVNGGYFKWFKNRVAKDLVTQESSPWNVAYERDPDNNVMYGPAVQPSSYGVPMDDEDDGTSGFAEPPKKRSRYLEASGSEDEYESE